MVMDSSRLGGQIEAWGQIEAKSEQAAFNILKEKYGPKKNGEKVLISDMAIIRETDYAHMQS